LNICSNWWLTGTARYGLPRCKASLTRETPEFATIARALVNRPKILFADEPTGNLDSATGEAILTLLREIQSTMGMTIVMVTHERALAERYAQRLIFLADGKLVGDESNSAAAVSQVGANGERP